LRAAQLRVRQPPSEQVHQLIGQTKEHQPDRVGLKAGAGEPVGLELVLEFLNVAVGLAAALIEVEQALEGDQWYDIMPDSDLSAWRAMEGDWQVETTAPWSPGRARRTRGTTAWQRGTATCRSGG